MGDCEAVLDAYVACNSTDFTNCTDQQVKTYWRQTAECLNKEFDHKYFKAGWQLLRIEFYVSVTAFLVSILAVFGATRRRRDSTLLKVPVFLAYAFSSKLVYYSLGLMQAVSFIDEPLAFWAAFLLIALAKADSMTVFSVDANEGMRRFLSDAVLQFLLVSYLIYSYFEVTKYYLILCVLVFWGPLKAFGTAKAMTSASMSSGFARSSKLVYEFMQYEYEHEFEMSPNLNTIASCNYLVSGEDEVEIKRQPESYEDNKVVTLQKVWKCEGGIITSSKCGSRCKDLCLSYALFRLICCKFGGYSFPICAREKSWNLVRHGLISETEDGSLDHERVFRVIEVELGFLYDFLYTKYPLITGKEYLVFRFLEIAIVGLGCWAAAARLTPFHNNEDYAIFIRDIAVTVIVIGSMVLVQLVELFYLITSDWLKVKLICRYVQKSSWWIEKKMIMVICSIQWKPWVRKVKQYSFLESFRYTPSIVYNCCLAIDKPRKGQKKSKEVELPEGVKKAIVASLNVNGPKLSNGLASLRRNRFGDQLGWACKLETTTHVILVWHIATSLCEIQLSGTSTELVTAAKIRNSETFVVANSLSKYCAYLVAFQPKLLPDHPCITESIFGGLVKEARKSLKKCKTKFDKRKKMMELGQREQGEGHNSILHMGGQLGLLLMQGIQNDDVRWKVLADFWAELVLFLAPSEELKAHAEQLASGGEFLTHLMALLFHAGILDRPIIDQDL